MFDPAEILTASSPEQSLVNRIAVQEKQIADMLAPYEPLSATYAWLDTFRAIEECINLITVDWEDDNFERDLISLPVSELKQENLNRLVAVRQCLAQRFGQNFGNRFTNLLVQGASISTAFAQHGIDNVAADFRTVGTMIGYFQSRRRHFIAMLHMLPNACRGRQIMAPLDTLNIFLPIIEFTAIQMMGAQNALIVNLSRSSLGLPQRESGDLAMLDSLFLEPERAQITEMSVTDKGVQILQSKEVLDPGKLFSATELRNDIRLIEAAYAEFDLNGTDFSPAAAIVRKLSTDFIDRDFWILIAPQELSALLDEFNATPALRSALVNTAPGYAACLSTYAPFVLVDGAYRTTVTLLSRFIYHWRAQILDHQKRFQIRSGFIFEKSVAAELERQGFLVQDITRINRHEFDVVALRGDVIWNVQCKNNFVNLASVENDAQRFARYNLKLVRYYERALTKERNREHLLKAKLSRNTVQHVVVSRFPVVSDNIRFVPFSRISAFAAKADALLVAGANG